MLEMNMNGGKAIVIDDQGQTLVYNEKVAQAIKDAHVNSDTEPAFTLAQDSGREDDKKLRGGQA